MRYNVSRIVLASVSFAVLAAVPAGAWWDTQLIVTRPVKLVKEFPAAKLDVPAGAVVKDPQADGGRGGDVVTVEAGRAPLVLPLTLEQSHYALWVIGRVDREELPALRPPLYIHLRLQDSAGVSREWRVRCNYLNTYADVAQIYFPVYAPGNYTATISLGQGSAVKLLVDRLELRDALGDTPKKGAKTRRTLMTDAQLAQLRKEYAQKNPSTSAVPLAAAARAARNEALWASWPPRNALQGAVGDPAKDPVKAVLDQVSKAGGVTNVAELVPWKPTNWDEAWGFKNAKTGAIYGHADYALNKPCGGAEPWADAGDGALFPAGKYGNKDDVAWGWVAANNAARLSQLVSRICALAVAYRDTADANAAWDAAILLTALSDLYPDLDYRVQNTGMQLGSGGERGTSFRYGFSGGGFGKILYCNWESSGWINLCVAYDQLFDFISGNQELARFVGARIPWVKTPRDVTALIDVNLLEHGVDCFRRRQITAEDEDKSHLAALILGPGEVADWVLDSTTFRCVDMRMSNAGGIDDQSFSSYTREGTGTIGSLGYSKPDGLIRTADRLERFVAMGGNPRYNLADLVGYPNIVGTALSFFDVYTCGGFSPIQGDSRSVYATRELPQVERREIYAAAFRWTRDPRHAWMLFNACGRGGEDDAEWAAISKAAAGARDPRLAQLPRVLGGAGFAILESGYGSDDYRFKRAAVLTYVTGVGHAHQDTLDLGLFAHGCRLAPDLGGRHEGKNRGTPNMRINRVHNLVEVDGRNFQNVMPGSTTAGYGWVEVFKALPGVQMVTASARATSHPQVSTYRRTVALVDVDEGKPAAKPPSTPVYSLKTKHDPDVVTANSYVFDVFRVAGGKVHTYCFHGAQSGYRGKPIKDLKTNVALAPAASDEAKNYLGAMTNPREGRAPDTIEATWELDPSAERSFMGADFNPDGPRKFTKLSMPGMKDAQVLVGNAFSDNYGYDWPFLYVRQGGAQERSTVFPAVIEMFAGEPFLASERRLSVVPSEGGALAPVALEVKTKSGFTDVLFSSGQPETETEIEGGIKVRGQFAFVRTDADGLRQAALVGGSELSDPGRKLSLKMERGAYETRIVKVDPATESLTLDGVLPRELIGEEALVGSPRNWTSFTIADIQTRDGVSTVRFTRSGRFYQSVVTHVDEAGKWISCEIPPPFYRADIHYYDNGYLVNESGTGGWRIAKVGCEERWMHLGWPGYRGSLPVDIAEKDVTDADGDGRRTLRIYAKDEKEQAGEMFNGKPFYALDITRVDEPQSTFYFKMPGQAFWAEDSWGYNTRRLANEAGTKTWEARYPGFSYQIYLEGGAVAQKSFDDADGDGRVKIKVFRFGPGDTLRIEPHASLSRVDKDTFELRSNVPVKAQAPGRIVPAGQNK